MPDHSQVEICNRALQKCGSRRISSISEDTVPAEAVAATYDLVLEAMLQAHPWKFAITRVELAEDDDAPALGRDRAFTLPSDCLRLLPPYPEDDFNTRDWQIEGRKIYTDDDAPLEIRYVYLVTDPNVMSPLFREAFAAQLAVEIVEQLTQSNTKKVELVDEARVALRRAMSADAQEGPPTEANDSSWLTSRA